MENYSTEQASHPGFHVFSIRQRASDQQDSKSKQYITRKSHKKSRLGCIGCKSKRVKCDEQRPKCGRCEKTKVACDYTSRPPVPKARRAQEHVAERHSQASLSIVAQPSLPLMDALQRSPLNLSLNLLKHYDHFTGVADTVTCSDILERPRGIAYRADVLRLAQEHSFLLHAIMAVAALHLTSANVPGYGLAKLQHLQVALTDLQRAIDKPISKRGADAVLLTSMMIAMQSFSWIDSTDPRSSWVFSEEPGRLDWMQAQLGNLPLLMKLAPHLTDSILKPIWAHSSYVPDAFVGVPERMLTICGVRRDMIEIRLQANPYYEMLQMLGPLMLVPRGTPSFVKYVRFMNRITRPFFELVQTNDLAALLVLSYWYGLMCHVDFWWTEKRSRRDCIALCTYLERHGTDAMRSLLHFPAKSCGYNLSPGVPEFKFEEVELVERITDVERDDG